MLSLVYSLFPEFSENICKICFEPVKEREVTFQGRNNTPFKIRNPSLKFLVCPSCGYAFTPGNYWEAIEDDYVLDNREVVPRVGDGIRPGREYYMADGGLSIFNGQKSSILIFGSGKSRDHELLRKRPDVSLCCISDVQNFQESHWFLPVNAKKKFNIVIACEVVEHFSYPRRDFHHLFQYLKKDGLLIVSTNIKKDDDFSKRVYPFLTGHVSYYTAASLGILARWNRMYIDFRLPWAGTHGLKGKRYIYFTKSADTQRKAAMYFGEKVFAEAEHLEFPTDEEGDDQKA